MKKLFTTASLVLGSLLLCGSADAAITGFINKNSLSDFDIKSRVRNLRASLDKAESRKAATRSADAPGNVIYEVDGMAMPYTMTYDGFMVGMEGIDFFEGMTDEIEVVMDNDGYVYIKDIIPLMACDSYIKGEMTEDGKVKFNLPQTVYYENDEDYGEMWADVSLVYSSDLNAEIPEEVTENNVIYFTIREDGSLTLDPLGEGRSLSLIAQPDQMWYGISETAITLTEGVEEKGGVQLPEGVEPVSYSYIFDTSFYTDQSLPNGKPDYGYHLNVAFDGNDVYFGGLFIEAPDSWVKGRREGDKVILPGNQYLGTMRGIGDFYLMYCKWSSPDHQALTLLPPEETEFTFIFDEANHTFTPADKEVMPLMNASDNAVRALELMEDPTFIYQPDASGAPASPWGLEYAERKTYGEFYFNLPNVTADGVLLYNNDLYYNIFADGEVIEYYADEYDDFTEDTTDIPYNMNKNIVVREVMSSFHGIIVPMIGIETVGVQTVNVWKGEKYYSPLVELNVTTGEITVGVESIAEPAGEAIVTRYDLFGRKVTDRHEGICITRKVFNDGTVKTVKEIMK